MKRAERSIYYDTDLQGEVYELRGIAQKFVSHFQEGYVIGLVEDRIREFVCSNNQYTLLAGDILLINPLEIHGCEQSGEKTYIISALISASRQWNAFRRKSVGLSHYHILMKT